MARRMAATRYRRDQRALGYADAYAIVQGDAIDTVDTDTKWRSGKFLLLLVLNLVMSLVQPGERPEEDHGDDGLQMRDDAGGSAEEDLARHGGVPRRQPRGHLAPMDAMATNAAAAAAAAAAATFMATMVDLGSPRAPRWIWALVSWTATGSEGAAEDGPRRW